MLSEISQAEKDEYYKVSLLCSLSTRCPFIRHLTVLVLHISLKKYIYIVFKGTQESTQRIKLETQTVPEER